MTSFKLTEAHIKLLRHMYVEWDNCETGAPAIDPKRPYGNSYVAGDVYEILTENDSEYLSEEQEQYYLEIHKQTLEALKVFLHNATITPGDYEVFDGWYESLATQEDSTTTDKRINNNEKFQHLVKTLKTKLVEKGWASEFKVNTLVKLIANHFSELVTTIPEKPQEDSNVTEDYLISEWFDLNDFKVYYTIIDGKNKMIKSNFPTRINSLDEAKELVRKLRKYKTPIFHKVD